MTRLARSLACALTLTLPGAAQASPATIAALRTVAVVNDSGVAEALVQPAEPGATQVTVMVSTTPGQPATPVAPPAVVPTDVDPHPQLAGYQPLPYADRIHKDRKSGAGMLTAGMTLGTLAYVFTSFAGAQALDKARRITDDPLTPADEGQVRRDRRAYGRALLIPGIGPAMAIGKADTAMRAWGAGMAGLTQAVALGLTIVGLYRLGRARRLERLSVAAMGTAEEAHVALRVRF